MDMKPKTWRERLPRWMGGTTPEPEPSPAMSDLEAQIEAIRQETAFVEAKYEAMRRARLDQLAASPTIDPTQTLFVASRVCPQCKRGTVAWRTYADGSFECLPCSQAVR